MADNVEIKGLEFQIVGDAAQAEKGLRSFVNTLNRLKKIGEKGLGLSSVIQELREVQGAVGEIDPTNLTSLANAIQTISSSSRRLTTVRGHLQGIADIDFSNLSQAADAIQRMGLGRGGGQGGQTTPEPAVPPVVDEPEQEHVEGYLQVVQRIRQAFSSAKSSASDFFQNVKAKSIESMSQAKLLKMEIKAIKKELREGITSGNWDDKRIASTAMSLQKLKSQLKGITPMWKQIAGNGLKSIGGALVSPIANLGESFKKAATAAKGFLRSIGRIALYRLIRAALSALTKGLKEGIGYLNLYSKSAGTQFHKSLNTLATDALYLKASLAAAVAPIVDALAPALDFLADKIATVLNLLAQLFAKLSGKGTYTRAVKAQTEYTDSISKAAGSTKDFLADFDELNVFNPNSGGGGGSELADWKNMFEEAEIDEELGNFVDRLKEAFKAGDWDGLGKILADKVNEIFGNEDLFSGIGTKLGYALNAAIKTAYSFIHNTDFQQIGKRIAEFLNHALDEIDFYTLGRLIYAKFTAALDFLRGLLGNLNWERIGESIGDFFRGAFDEISDWIVKIDWDKTASNLYSNFKKTIKGIDFATLAQSFFRLFGAALGASVRFIASFIRDVIKDIATYFLGFIEDENGDGKFGGKEIINGILKGIWEGIKNIGRWIKENIFDPFIQGFKDAFGIHSPSTVMIEYGKMIVEGLYQGIKDWINKGIQTIKDWATKVFEWFTGGDGKGNIFEKFKNAGRDIVNGFRDKVSSTYMTVKTTITTWANGVYTWFTGGDGWNGIVKKFETVASNIITGFKNKVSTTYTTVKTSITTWASKVKEWFTSSSFGGINIESFEKFANDAITGFKNKITNTYNTVKTSITTWANAVKDWFTNTGFGGVNGTTFANFANDVITSFKDKVSNTYSTVKTSITTWASSVKDWFTSSSFGGVNFSTFATYASNIIDGFKEKISSTYSTVQSSITTWASYVKDWFSGASYGNVNSTTFYTYASNVITGFKNGISNTYSTVQSSITTWASNVKTWFTNTVSYSSFYSIASDVIDGFKNGIGNLYSTMKSTIDRWGSSIISWFKSKLDSNSPSKVFEQIGKDTVLGYDNGIEKFGKKTKGIIGSWADSFTSVTPTMKFAVDTSALRYYDSTSFARNISTDISTKTDFSDVGFADAMAQFYHEYLEPALIPMAEDMRRQADKKEQTVVNIGNRTVKDAVTMQTRADGFQFVKA